MKLKKEFFKRNSKVVAQELLGKVLVRKINGKELRARIVETEAYFDERDPASWARFGKRKDNLFMWAGPGRILIKNVHKYNMLNFVTGEKGKPEAVLIRALEPLNFDLRCCGPGLLTIALGIDKSLNGNFLFDVEDLWLESCSDKEGFEIYESFRVGVRNDLDEKLRFYIKDSVYVSKK